MQIFKKPKKNKDKKAINQKMKITLEQDLLNMGYWLYVEDEYFSWDHKVRFTTWFTLIVFVQTCQLVFFFFLTYERMDNESELNEALDLLNQNKTAEFKELHHGLQD